MKFQLGRCVATPAALDLLAQNYVLPDDLLDRHAAGDWGDLSEEDKAANEIAIEDGSRIFSAYQIGIEKVYIETDAQNEEGGREHTTIMLTGEY